MRFWTADLHLGHAGIVLHCGRPFMRQAPLTAPLEFRDAEHAKVTAARMNDRLIAYINERCKPSDTLVHVGDFSVCGVVSGLDGLRIKAEEYLRRINCHTVLVEGNHDSNNHVKTACRSMIINLQGRRVFVSHFPTDNENQDPEYMAYIYGSCAFAICGHVHEKWKFRHMHVSHGRPTFLNVNVGVDQWKYRPVSDDELVRAVNAELKQPKGS